MMEHRIGIRPVRLGDEVSLAHIQTESWKAAFRDIVEPGLLRTLTEPEAAQRMYRRLLEEGIGNGYLLELDGKPHCIAYWDKSRDNRRADYAELICIHSLPDNWRQGCGSRMMERVLQDIRETGFRNVLLWVFRDNTRAISFYEKHGFAPNGIVQEAFGAVEVMYERTL